MAPRVELVVRTIYCTCGVGGGWESGQNRIEGGPSNGGMCVRGRVGVGGSSF